MDDLNRIAAEEANRHPDSIEDAVGSAVNRLHRLKGFDAMVGGLVNSAVRSIICDVRHAANVVMRQASGGYTNPAKVRAGEAVNRVAADYFTYFINGRTLGSITGEELPDIGASESQRASGHEFNARLCAELGPLVTKTKTVRECVKPAKLDRIFKALGTSARGQDAA